MHKFLRSALLVVEEWELRGANNNNKKKGTTLQWKPKDVSKGGGNHHCWERNEGGMCAYTGIVFQRCAEGGKAYPLLLPPHHATPTRLTVHGATYIDMYTYACVWARVFADLCWWGMGSENKKGEGEQEYAVPSRSPLITSLGKKKNNVQMSVGDNTTYIYIWMPICYYYIIVCFPSTFTTTLFSPLASFLLLLLLSSTV